jgi:hypothetical protein
MIAQLFVNNIDRPDVVRGMRLEADYRDIVAIKSLAALMAIGEF